ncbi:MAG TPA: NADH:ubiquinone oxidoreductase [Candidatus Goldiibacteriota bacterium]|nr:NADH:ubiquinone oxidoreductase [Candidatus Goldiibacteriota bacterium]
MLEIIKIRARHGSQYVPDLKKASINPMFRGFPEISGSKPGAGFVADKLCPSEAISREPLAVDMGKCVFCGKCEGKASEGLIRFGNRHKLAADSAEKMLIGAGITADNYEKYAVKSRKGIKDLFGRSLKLRQVSAGGCNGCELELNACGNVNFDMGRYGIEFTASPRHSDGIVITGPITKNMSFALEETYEAMPGPKIIILCGACAISGGIFADSEEIDRSFVKKNKADLYIPGCPPHPLNVINGILSLLGR